MQQALNYIPHGTFDVQYAAIEKAYTTAKKDNDFIVIFRQFPFFKIHSCIGVADGLIDVISFSFFMFFRKQFNDLAKNQRFISSLFYWERE